MFCLPGNCCFPQLVCTSNIQGSALLALEKNDSLKHVGTETHCGTGSDADVCINVSSDYKENTGSFIQVK